VQCVPSGQHTPSETFKIADSHPEVEDRVEPLAPTRSPLFHNKHRYPKIGVHEVSASDGRQYTVLYLATGTRNPNPVLSFLPCCPGSHPGAVLILFFCICIVLELVYWHEKMQASLSGLGWSPCLLLLFLSC